MINLFVIFSIITRLITISLLITYVIPRQIHEVRREKDQFSKLRLYVLALILFFSVASSPVIIYQSLTIYSQHSALQNVASIANTLANLAFGVVLVLIYNYKYEE